ncbi:hypothetical protein Metev_1281 [Methanohalobium evestigatum Z-7303]|uniref:Uncharacterized protein n=2 Tax=Methanohalobium evestigatum TaxID=2322 RepID=D7E7S2_METEZ|nr:hypothetical protein Metev_1281 [Methanohalobium evestigatum Z-7303]
MCCESQKHQRGYKPLKSALNCECGCNSGHSFRDYLTAKEKQEFLEEYKSQLKEELKAVDEHLQNLKG